MLTNLNNQTLLSELSELVKKERELVTQVLKYLTEVESRKLYLERGYSSMFKFCVEYLCYSEAEAMMRIQAMRLMRSLPQIEDKIESGNLSLTNAAQIHNQFRKESQRRVELKQAPLDAKEKLEIINELEKTSTRQCEKKLASIFPEIQLVEPQEKTKILRDEKYLIQFTADQELMNKLEKLKGLLAHQNFQGRYDLLFNELADLALKKLDPELKGTKPRASNATPPGSPMVKGTLNPTPPGAFTVRGTSNPTPMAKPETTASENFASAVKTEHGRSRYIPQSVKRQVWLRAKGQCEYCDPLTGKTCSSRHALEFDHKLPFSKGHCESHPTFLIRLIQSVSPGPKAKLTTGVPGATPASSAIACQI